MLASNPVAGLCPVLWGRPDSLRGATLCMELCLIPMRTVWKCGELVTDSVLFVMIAFKVILGMDQLTRHFARWIVERK